MEFGDYNVRRAAEIDNAEKKVFRVPILKSKEEASINIEVQVRFRYICAEEKYVFFD